MKKLHKLGAALLAACMLCSMSMTAFAADTNLDPDTTSGDTNITAKTSIPGEPAYTITIPGTIDVGDISKTAAPSIKSTPFDVVAASVADLNGKQVDVSVSTSDGTFNLVDASANDLPYQVFNTTADGEALTNGGLFTSFTADGTVTGRVDIDQADIEAAGTYTGTLTFTIALADSVS